MSNVAPSPVQAPDGSAEIALLIHCCSSRSTPAIRAELGRRITDGVQWVRLLQLAGWHRLQGLLRMHLEPLPERERIPPEILKQLEAVHGAGLEKQKRDRWELQKVLLALESSGIRVIVLKGAALAEAVYPSPALRPMGDIDLLVEESQLEATEAIIRSLGYGCPDPPALQKAMKIHHRHYPPLFSRDGRVCFEIHRHIARNSSVLHFDITGFWQRAEPAEIADARALVLSVEDLLIHLLLNLFQDARQRHPSRGAFGKLTDLAETFRYRGDRIDGSMFIERAEAHGLTGPVICGLMALERVLGVAPSCDRLQEWLRRDARMSSAHVDDFIRIKLLAEPERDWYFHELVEPPDPPTLANELRSAARRIGLGSRDLTERHRPRGQRWRDHLGTLPRVLASVFRHPRLCWEHRRMDRWMYALMLR